MNAWRFLEDGTYCVPGAMAWPVRVFGRLLCDGGTYLVTVGNYGIPCQHFVVNFAAVMDDFGDLVRVRS